MHIKLEICNLKFGNLFNTKINSNTKKNSYRNFQQWVFFKSRKRIKPTTNFR